MLAVVEAGAAAACWLVVVPRANFLVWRPDPAMAREAALSTARVDEETGWPAPDVAKSFPRDRRGAKYNPDFPDLAPACISAYGDSFVWGDDVALSEGWIEQMARKLGCPITNYAVPGYGTDQALIRFRRNKADEAPVTLLGIFPENLMRNVNQYRGFLFGAAPNPQWLKGRFVLDARGELAWIARPRLGVEQFVRLQQRPAEFLPHEYLLPDSNDGPVSLRFPYILTLARIALMPRVRARFTGRPSWSAFFAPDHASGTLALTVAIAEAFAREARQRQKTALVLILPSAGSFRGHAAYGEFEYASLAAALTARGVKTLDLGPLLLERLGPRYCELYAQPASCEGHYGRSGGAIVADVVARALVRAGLVRSDSKVSGDGRTTRSR
jgi:hypothetical protein